MSEEKTTWRSMLKRPSTIFVALTFGCWWAFVVLSGMGVGVGRTWDFSATAQLGDSFGILSAFMASMAAIFTFQTLTDTRRQADIAEADSALQRTELERQREEIAQEKAASSLRDLWRDQAEFKRDSERTFFGLLELRFHLLKDLQVGNPEARRSGTDATEFLVRSMEPSFYESGETNYAIKFEDMYKDRVNELGHYFRFTYHVIKFADDKFGDESYPYIQLLRAQISNSETILIALNCAHGEGRDKFTPLLEKYSFLHNINPDDRQKYRLDNYFSPKAFNPS